MSLLEAAEEYAASAPRRGCVICRAGADAHAAVAKLAGQGVTCKQIADFLTRHDLGCDGDHVYNHVKRHGGRFRDAEKAKPHRRG